MKFFFPHNFFFRSDSKRSRHDPRCMPVYASQPTQPTKPAKLPWTKMSNSEQTTTVRKSWLPNISDGQDTCPIHGQLKYCSCVPSKRYAFSAASRALPPPHDVPAPIRRVHTFLPDPRKDIVTGNEDDEESKKKLRDKRYFQPDFVSSEDRATAYLRHNLLLGNVHPPSAILNNTVFIHRWLAMAGSEATMFPSLQ